jgi:hypothetical protein
VRRGGNAAALLSVAALLLAIWVTSTTPVHLLPSNPTSPATHTATPLAQAPHRAPGPVAHRPTPPTVRPGSVFGLFDYLTLGAIAALLIAFLVTAVRRRNRRPRRSREAVPELSPDVFKALQVPPTLVEAAERQLRAIHEGSPRNAIVACWMELERTCRDTGFARASSETSAEFTGRILAHYSVDAGAVDLLAGLYREARYSEHQLSELHRGRAVSSLERILGDLRVSPGHATAPVSRV